MSRSRDYINGVPSETAERILRRRKRAPRCRQPILFLVQALLGLRPRRVKNTSKIEETKQTFPAEATINKYGFLYLSKEILTALRLQKGEEIKVRLQQTPEGLLVTKATSGAK